MSDAIEVPQPVQWAVNIAAQESQRAAKVLADIADMDQRIIATQTLLDQLVSDKDAAGTDYARSAANAGLAREMAERACADHGWVMPPVPVEPPLHETQAFPAVQPAHVCCVCGNAPGTYENYQHQWFCQPCADGEPPAAPADPAVTLTDLDATPKDGADHAER